ncbi:MerC family mercury resistance protein, partial [Salmonella enterica]|uniref:MerC family mercury resistance protein n=1 Tax=Salmonella enterica TaxID=28901 RepID=UPI003CF5BCF9
MAKTFDYDRVGAYASTLCAIHCLITGVGLGLLSVMGLQFFGSAWVESLFIG